MRKTINRIITVLAVVGVIIIIGAVGKCDQVDSYPLIEGIKTILIGCALGLPAFIREVIK